MTVKEQILKLVGSSKTGLPYAQLTAHDEFKGSCALSHAKFPMVQYWQGLSQPAAEAILELATEGIIRHEPTDTLAYVAHGSTLELPIFTLDQIPHAKALAKPHWMPVLLIKAQ